MVATNKELYFNFEENIESVLFSGAKGASCKKLYASWNSQFTRKDHLIDEATRYVYFVGGSRGEERGSRPPP